MADRPLTFSREAARAVDRITIEEYGVPGIVLMENAARALATAAIDLLERSAPRTGTVLIACGSGNNGGDGYATARHLHNAGLGVLLLSLGEPRSGTDAFVNRTICEKMHLPLIEHGVLASLQPALILDAIFGTGLDRPIEGGARSIIEWINNKGAHGVPIVAADIPSGLDCDTGRELGIAVRAIRTVSFLGLKKGFREPGAQEFTGEIVIGDIGAPIELVKSQQVKISKSQQ